MDSQLTSVGTHNPTSPGENIVLVFDKDDMLNTALRIRGKTVSNYIVNTIDNTTTIHTGDCLLAIMARKLFRRDQIAFPGSKPMALGSWLKVRPMSTFPFTFHAGGRRFGWRRITSGQLVMCEISRPGDVLAWFSSWWQVSQEGHVMHPAHLAIKPEISEIKDAIVLSCVLVEHKLRSAAEIQTTPAVGMTMYC